MKLLFKLGISLLFLATNSTNLLASNDQKDIWGFEVIHSNNSNLTGGPNDLGPTGDVEFIMNKIDEDYKVILRAEAFVNGEPNLPTAHRSNTTNYRIDMLSIALLVGKELKYGIGFQDFGNYGGVHIQNFIHKTLNDIDIPAKYSGYDFFSPTLNFEYNYKFNNWVEANIEGYLAMVPNRGISHYSYNVRFLEESLFDTDIEGSISIGSNCTVYPEMIEFEGYPINKFEPCFQESIISLGYRGVKVFWEIPLENQDIQNSILGISYKF